MPQKKWNVMIYLAGDNNLSEEMVWALTEINSANLGDNEVSVLFDPRGTRNPVCLFEAPVPPSASSSLHDRATVLFTSDDERQQQEAAFRNAIVGKYKVPPEWQLQPENTADPLVLLYFLWRALRQRPNTADTEWQDMLIISGHGSGLDEDFLARDENPRGSLTIRGIADVLKCAVELSGRKISILGLDSCQLSTAEVYTQVAPSIRHMVGAEGFEPNSGWPYGPILSSLPQDPADACEEIVRRYLEFYFEYPLGGESVDLSACRTQSEDSMVLPERLEVSVSDLGKSLRDVLRDPRFRDAIILAHWWAQSYSSDQYVDLVDFAEELSRRVSEIPSTDEDADTADHISRIQTCCHEVIRAVGGPGKPGIVTATGYVGPAFQHSRGLSVYFPWSHVMTNYGHLTFARVTQWDRFLEEYVTATRRPLRLRESQQPVAAGGTGTSGTGSRGLAAGGHRANEPFNKANEPFNKGGCTCISMKNPATEWGRCDLLRGYQVPTRDAQQSPAQGLPGPLF